MGLNEPADNAPLTTKYEGWVVPEQRGVHPRGSFRGKLSEFSFSFDCFALTINRLSIIMGTEILDCSSHVARTYWWNGG
jgi:hypothetical protein